MSVEPILTLRALRALGNPPVPIIGRARLAELLTCKCSRPGCTARAEFIHSRCHMEAGCSVQVAPDASWVLFSCAECEQPIVGVIIAEDA